MRLYVGSTVSEDSIGTRHFQWRRVIGPKGDGWCGLGFRQTRSSCYLYDGLIPDHLGKLHRCHVHRFRERGSKSEITIKLVPEVVGRVGLPVKRKRCGLIFQNCCRCYGR